MPNPNRILLALIMAGFVWALLQGFAPVSSLGTEMAATEKSGVALDESPDGKKGGAHPVEESGAHGEGGGHEDPFSLIILLLAVVMLLAMVGRWAAARLHQPSVLGELLIGVLLGNALYAFERPLATLIMHMDEGGKIFREIWTSGVSVSEAARKTLPSTELGPDGVGTLLVNILTGPEAVKYVLWVVALWMFSQLGVILLLFMVGLESRVDEMLRVGPRALLVAITGIVAPFVLSYGVTLWFLPGDSPQTHLFVAAIMCATSVGITARVFKDLDRLYTHEAKIILGAAVIDDVLGLILLAVVAGIRPRARFTYWKSDG